MDSIKIYKNEESIADLIKNNNSISHLVEIQESKAFPIDEKIIANVIEKANQADRVSFDLHFLKSLLVSSVWNGNDDYFLVSELWLARNTAKDKPFNFEHECDDIIGHMTNSYVIDSEGHLVSNDTSVDKIPSQIHIISEAVLYKRWAKPDKQDRMNKLLAEIKENKWFVSVECLFPDFDYVLKSDNNDIRLIARNEQTSFLTKYLRVYNGSGVYNNQKIGRVPRNFILSGKGLVEKPANKSSVIFAKKYEISQNNLFTVYNTLEGENKMDDTKELQYKDTIKKLEADLIQLKASVDESKVKEVQVKLDTVTKTAEANAQQVEVLKASIEGLNKEKLEIAKVLETLQTQKKEAEDKLSKIETEQRYNTRINLCKAKLGMDDEQAKSFTNSLNLLDDTNFASHVDFQHKFIQAKANVTQTVVPDPKVLDGVNKDKVETPTLNVTAETTSVQAKIEKLRASVEDYMLKSGHKKVTEPKFKLDNK